MGGVVFIKEVEHVYPCGCIMHHAHNITHCERHSWDERGALRNRADNPAAAEYKRLN